MAWRRRSVLAAGAALAGAALAGGVARAQEAPVLLVSRKRLLNDTEIARALLRAEIALTAELQRQVDDIKANLNGEEQELTRLRSSLDREEFDRRVKLFDQQVRSERRRMQRHAAALQNAFRAARVKLTGQLDPVLEEVRVAHGAAVILNSDQALALDPSRDITDEVVRRVNETVPMPEIPTLESLDLGPEAPPDPSGAGTGDIVPGWGEIDGDTGAASQGAGGEAPPQQ